MQVGNVIYLSKCHVFTQIMNGSKQDTFIDRVTHGIKLY